MPGPADLPIAVVVPAYQAQATIASVVARTFRAVPAAYVIVVDDGSSDGTGDVGRRTGALVLSNPTNRGKGAALRAGAARALEDGASVVVTLDADGQHPPEDIPRLMVPITQGKADLVLGARPRSGSMPWSRRLTNWLSARLATRIGGQGVSDAQTGYRAFTRAVAERVRPTEARYDYETAFLLGALEAGFRVASVPIPTIYADARSHFRPWGDTWRVARVFARHARRIVAGAA
jgi:glycosyltransferase involved in cell wall biosynthesis